jgi:hypothetical protein
VKTFRSAWEKLLLLPNGIEPTRQARGQRPSNKGARADQIVHWHDLRHKALSRVADDGVPVHELQMLAGHANITTTQRSTQYALLSSTYTYVGKLSKGFSGVMVEWLAAGRTLLDGYALFFIGCGLLGVPALILCIVLARATRQPERAPAETR